MIGVEFLKKIKILFFFFDVMGVIFVDILLCFGMVVVIK